MKKLAACLTLAAALTVTAPLSAQKALGFRAGANIADLSLEMGGVSPDLDTRTGFRVEAYLDLPLGENLFLQPGFGLSQKGAELSEDEVTVGLHLDYLEIPLLLKYAFPTSGALGIHLMGGPALAFELSCDLAISGGGFSADVACDQGSEEADVEIDTKAFDLGLMVGGGISFPVGSVRMGFDVLYDIGLLNIADGATDGDSAKHRVLSLTAGVAFPLGD